MIPLVEAKLEINTTIPEDISFASRAEYIRSLPNFLSAVIEAPDGLNLVNISNETPQVQDRDKPWFKTNAYGTPLGIFLWNETDQSWMNICPYDVDQWLAEVQRAVEASNNSLTSSLESQATAEQHESFATSGAALTDAADTATDAFWAIAQDALTATRADAPPFLNGILTDQTFIIDPDFPRAEYAPGYVVTPWVALTNPLNPAFEIHGFYTLVNDNYPNALFQCEIQCHADGDQIRMRGYEIYPETSYYMGDPPVLTPRTIDFMWVLKGVLA